MMKIQCVEKIKKAEAAAKANAYAQEVAKRCPKDICPPKPTRMAPPIVLTGQRYNKILSNATGTDKSRAAAERSEEEKYREYLKNGSDELVKHFGANIKRTQEQKLEDLRLAFEEKRKHAEQAHKGQKDTSAAQRLEKLTKAKKILEKLKPGPRELHSAVMESEILHGRELQIAINEKYAKAINQQECLDRKACAGQASMFIGEDAQRIAEELDRKNVYKIELKQTIDERQQLHLEKRRHEMKEAKAAREAVDREVQLEIEKERELMKRKKETARRNALEAMKIAEQRRIRERMACEIESRIACVFNVGKDQLKKMTEEHSKERKIAAEKHREETIKIITSMQKEDPRFKEEERLLKFASEMRLKFTAEEEKKKRKYQQAKLARIHDHLQEVERQKMIKAMAAEQQRFDMADRFKNTEINCIFNEELKQRNGGRAQEIRAALDRQIKDKKSTENAIRTGEIKDSNDSVQHYKDDCHFFEYAANLMEDARKKGRPIQPFIRAVQQYKRNNHINMPEKVGRHLVSNININNKNDNNVGKPIVGSGVVSKPKLLTEVEMNCFRIEKAIAEDAAEKRKVYRDYCPIDCMQHKQGITTTIGADKCDGLRNELKSSSDDCISMTPSARLRYSVWQLKQLNKNENADCSTPPSPPSPPANSRVEST